MKTASVIWWLCVVWWASTLPNFGPNEGTFVLLGFASLIPILIFSLAQRPDDPPESLRHRELESNSAAVTENK